MFDKQGEIVQAKATVNHFIVKHTCWRVHVKTCTEHLWHIVYPVVYFVFSFKDSLKLSSLQLLVPSHKSLLEMSIKHWHTVRSTQKEEKSANATENACVEHL